MEDKSRSYLTKSLEVHKRDRVDYFERGGGYTAPVPPMISLVSVLSVLGTVSSVEAFKLDRVAEKVMLHKPRVWLHEPYGLDDTQHRAAELLFSVYRSIRCQLLTAGFVVKLLILEIEIEKITL